MPRPLDISVKKTFLVFVFVFFIASSPSPTHAFDFEPIFKFGNSFFPSISSNSSPTLTEEEIVNLSKSATVRIINNVVGTTTFRLNFKPDFVNLKFVPQKEIVLNLPIDYKTTGTGFIITPNGHILTNAHVITSSTSQETAFGAVDVLKEVVALFLVSSSEKDLKKFGAYDSTPEGTKKLETFGEELAKKIMESGTTTLTNTLAVLNPSSSAETRNDLFKQGFPAKVVYANDNYEADDRDIAIIKIEKDNLPAIPLSNPEEAIVKTGQRIYTFGFPSNADGSSKVSKNYLEPSFTSGLVSSFKDSFKNDFKLIQTDAKISSGSSGSPVLNDQGKVVGIIAKVTNKSTQSSGDSFASAIPLEPILEILTKAKVTPEAGNQYTYFISGNKYLHEKRCRLAIQEFTKAENVNTEFYPVNTITQYIEKCKEMQANKESIDSENDLFRKNIKPYGKTIYAGLGGLILFIIILMLVIKRMRHDEKKMAELEKMSGGQTPSAESPATANNPVPTIAQQPIQQTVPPTPQQEATPATPNSERLNSMISYIRQKNTEGAIPGNIVLGLQKEGYASEEIVQAFELFNSKKSS